MNEELRMRSSHVAFAFVGLAFLAALPALADPKVVRVCHTQDWNDGEVQIKDRPGMPATFSASAEEDIVFAVRLPKQLPEQPVLVLTVLLPDDFTYQVLEVPIAVDGKRGRQRRMVGYPHPVDERPIKATKDNDRVVEVSLPVGGTAISSNSLYGEWRVRAAITGGPTCQEATRFVITE